MISAIAAIGNNGQIGLNGGLPWPRHSDDMAFFRKITAGKIMIAGYRTRKSLVDIKWGLDRTLIGIGEGKNSKYYSDYMDMVIEENRDIIIIGGAATYRKLASHITTLYLSRINYKGPADTWFPIDAFTVAQIDNAVWR